MLEAQTTQLMTFEEAVEKYNREGKFEIYDGEIKPLMPHLPLHQWVARLLFRLLDSHCVANRLGEVLYEFAFVLLEDSKWVKGSRVPDVMFYSAARWAAYTESKPGWSIKPLTLIPDLVIEVVSPTDSYTDIQNKVDHYLKDGVRLIWVVDPQRKSAGVFEGDKFMALTEQDTLSGGEVVPGFSVALSDVFKVE
jgi:Uma2 family endonuclease